MYTPESRIRSCNDAPVREGGSYILHWMTAQRRAGWNFALQRSAEWARELGVPLLVLEALRCDYPHASDRLHRFVLDGMGANAAAFEKAGVRYHPYVEPERGAGRGLLEALSERACAVVTDDYPAFFLPRMVAAAAAKLQVRLEAVDSCGLFPIRAGGKSFPTAYSFRRFLQRELPPHLHEFPAANPLKGLSSGAAAAVPREVSRRWPRASSALIAGKPGSLDRLPIDHGVPPVAMKGGSTAGERRLRDFVSNKLDDYAERRNLPEEQGASGLSPYLHFGHVSSHRVFHQVARREGWGPDDVEAGGSGARSGWWSMGESAEAFLDQLVTWRELGFNMCAGRADYMDYESLPDWARATLAAHGSDERGHVYTLDQLDRAETHDLLWNAAQTQLRREGVIHNYLRMLWGKKILKWSPTPRQALANMIALNDRYALDGRDPNSYSGIFWVLGRYDRPWGPERPIFGKVRYMTSQNTARKMRVKGYIERYSGSEQGSLGFG